MPDEQPSSNLVLTALLNQNSLLQAQNALLQAWLDHLLCREKRLEDREKMLDELNAKRLTRIERHEDEEWAALALLRKMETVEYEERATQRAVEAAREDFPRHDQLAKGATS